MHVVILHCHYERGGVTQVVENHVRWLAQSDVVERVVLVSGNRASGLSESTHELVSHLVVDDFDYDDGEIPADQRLDRSSRITADLEQKLSEAGVSRDNSVLHWHNHSLGRNTAAPQVIRRLAESRWKLLLQIHDFAEDNRPDNYRRLIDAIGAAQNSQVDDYLYPSAEQIHYATLTRSDASVLTQLGLPGSRVHCLPNSVVVPAGDRLEREAALAMVRTACGLPSDARWCLYPVRGIRRKNVGEFLLLSRWTLPDHFAGLTLCPATPLERRSYERWRDLAVDVAPRAVFDCGHHADVSFLDNLAASDFILSTSVAEGFGMAFLEPWLVGREVVARRLPTTTDDFQANGVQLTRLYNSIAIPGERSWLEACRSELAAATEKAWAAVPERFRPMNDGGVADTTGDTIDFALLTPRRQVEVLRKAASDAGYESMIKQCNTSVEHDLTHRLDESTLKHNAEVIGRDYSPKSTGMKLISIYESLTAATSTDTVTAVESSVKAVDLVSASRPFYPCRTEVLDD